MRVSIDEDACSATGLCEITCPEVFEVGMVARVLIADPPAELHELVRQAEEDCPTDAIIVED